MSVAPGLYALLRGAIDYAGLYPPAKLDLATAFGNYVRYRSSPDAWMLGRFVVPAEKLGELAEIGAGAFGSGEPFEFAVVANLDGVYDDLAAMEKFQSAFPGRVSIRAVECKATPKILSKPQEFQRDFEVASAWLKAQLFLEVGFGDEWRRSMRDLRERFSVVFEERIGFKLRCGGAQAAAFPTSARIAEFLEGCREIGSDWKATAGLHHPLPTPDAGLGVVMQGFLNLWTAGVLGSIHHWSSQTIEAALEETGPTAFDFSSGVKWREWSATVKQISIARRSVAVSFGSCSFDEPRDDLRTLGLLEAASV